MSEAVEHKDMVVPVYKPLRAADLDEMHKKDGWMLMGIVHLKDVSLYGSVTGATDNIIYYFARKVR